MTVQNTGTLSESLFSPGCPWMFALRGPWLPAGAAEVLRAHGLQPAMHVTYMTATDLAPSLRSEPRLRFERVNSKELAQLAMHMNSESCEMRSESGAPGLNDSYAFIAYAEGHPVSTATTLNTGDDLHAVCVATPAEHQRHGYAEAVLRHSLNEARRDTGLRRMVLHATDAGFPMYQRMGFEPVFSMMLWAPAHAAGEDC